MWEETYLIGTKFIWGRDQSKMTYSIRKMLTDKNGSHPADELAYLVTYLAGSRLVIDNIFVDHGSPWYRGFEDSHMGTNLLSDALTDVYFRQNVHYTEVFGKLAARDSSGNWKNSIPFYRDFPKYLHPSLPFSMRFSLYEDHTLTVPVP